MLILAFKMPKYGCFKACFCVLNAESVFMKLVLAKSAKICFFEWQHLVFMKLRPGVKLKNAKHFKPKKGCLKCQKVLFKMPMIVFQLFEMDPSGSRPLVFQVLLL